MVVNEDPTILEQMTHEPYLINRVVTDGDSHSILNQSNLYQWYGWIAAEDSQFDHSEYSESYSESTETRHLTHWEDSVTMRVTARESSASHDEPSSNQAMVSE